MKRTKSNVDKSRTTTRGYAKSILVQSDVIAKTSSQPTWKHPRTNDEALEILTKRIEQVLAHRNDNIHIRTWKQLLRSNSTDFPVLLRFVAESLQLRLIRLIPNYENLPDYRKALFHQPFSIDMEKDNDELVETSSKASVSSKNCKVSSLSTSSTKYISARAQLNSICNEILHQPMMHTSTEHKENNQSIWKTTDTH